GGRQLPAREAVDLQVASQPPAQRRQRPSETGETGELRFVAHGGPAWMVEVLLAAGFVTTSGLEMALRIERDPDLAPGRRDHQLLDPLALQGVGQRLSVRPLETEARASPTPDVARLVVPDVAQTRPGGRLERRLVRGYRHICHAAIVLSLE